MSRASSRVEREIEALTPWFHNLHLPDGGQTAAEHPLGDFPRRVWQLIMPHVPEDLSGWTALDIGCNAGFYSFELARRGARVTAIDHDPHYLKQARWAARHLDEHGRVTFRQMQIYDLAHTAEQFDLVWFMGVFYHLRYPLLGLDIAARKVRRLMIFQTMTTPGNEVISPPENLPLDQRQALRSPGWPSMAFIEHRLADDPTNWWAPTHACVEAMLRSAQLTDVRRIAPEVYSCRPDAGREETLGRMLGDEFQAATGQGRKAS